MNAPGATTAERPGAVTGQRFLTERPSIAVLAFANMSGDPEQEYFSDGITEDIITELSRFSELFVIARNSSFQYKGKSVDVRQVGRELGVRYVLEGSIRRAGDRVRITAQLIDAATGAHRWAERYDRKLEDVFAVQDEVARTIVAMLAAHVNKAEIERTLAKPPAAWQAYDHYLRAAHTFALFHSSFSRADLLADAAQPGPGAGHRPQIRPGSCHPFQEFYCPVGSPMGRCVSMDCGHRRRPSVSSRGGAARPPICRGSRRTGWALSFMAQHEAAVAEFERATELNPNLTDHRFAWTLLVTGEPTRAIQTLKAQMRLDPFYVPHAASLMGFAYYLLGRYADALPHLQKAVRAHLIWSLPSLLAATYAQLGQLDKARDEAAEVLRIDPWFTIDQAVFAKMCKRPGDGEHFKDGLRKAGYPE